MKSLLKGAPALVVVAALLLVSTVQAEGTVLRYKFTEGQVLKFKHVEKTNIKVMEMDMGQEQVRYLEWTVQTVEEGVATIAVKMLRLTLKAANPMTGDIEFDSEKGEEVDNPQVKFMKHMVGKVYTIKINDRGTILDLKGMTKIGEEIAKKLEEESEGDPQTAMQIEQIKKMFSDETMKEQMSKSSTALPEEPVTVGFEWKNDSKVPLPMMGTLRHSIAMKVESVEGNTVKASIAGTMESDEAGDGEEGGEEGGMGAMMKFSEGKITGSLEFDTEIGQLRKNLQTIKVKVTGPMGEMPMEIISSQELMDEAPADDEGDDGGEEEE